MLEDMIEETIMESKTIEELDEKLDTLRSIINAVEDEVIDKNEWWED